MIIKLLILCLIGYLISCLSENAITESPYITDHCFTNLGDNELKNYS